MWINENAFISHLCCVFLLPIISNSFFRVGPISGQSSIAEATAKWRETGDAKEALKLMKGGTASASLEGIVLRALAKGSTYQQARTVRIPIRFFVLKFRKTFFFFLSFYRSSAWWCCPYSMHTIFSAWQKCWISTLEVSTSMPIRVWFGTRQLCYHTNYLFLEFYDYSAHAFVTSQFSKLDVSVIRFRD